MNKVRIVYEKNDSVKYLGHLDTIVMFDRTFRRSGIRIKYSNGFNPRASFEFALPSGTGVISKCEILEFELAEDENSCIDDIISRLNANLPNGFKIITGDFVNTKKSLMSKVVQAEFEILVYFRDNKIDKSIIKNIFNKKEILIDKKIKGNGINQNVSKTQIDIKPYIIDISFEQTDQGIKIVVLAKAGSKQNLRPDYITKVIENNHIDIYDYQIIKKRVILDDKENK